MEPSILFFLFPWAEHLSGNLNHSPKSGQNVQAGGICNLANCKSGLQDELIILNALKDCGLLSVLVHAFYRCVLSWECIEGKFDNGDGTCYGQYHQAVQYTSVSKAFYYSFISEVNLKKPQKLWRQHAMVHTISTHAVRLNKKIKTPILCTALRVSPRVV